MKYSYLLTIVLLVSCQANESISASDQTEFAHMAQTYQSTYMNGGANCEAIMSAMDQKLEMWENGTVWTFADLQKFCPHLPEKLVLETYNSQRLLEHNLGYDFVSQLYLNQKGDTMRETTSRIWKKSASKWRIIEMNNLLKRETDQ